MLFFFDQILSIEQITIFTQYLHVDIQMYEMLYEYAQKSIWIYGPLSFYEYLTAPRIFWSCQCILSILLTSNPLDFLPFRCKNQVHIIIKVN